MRANEFLPEKINFDSLEPGKEYHKSILNGKYHLYAKTKDDPSIAPGIIVYVTDKDEPKLRNTLDAIGYGRYIPKGDNLEVSFVNVKQNHQRQGIASAMYNFVRELGNDIAPSSSQSNDAKAFWAAGAGVNKTDIIKSEPTIEPKNEPISLNKPRKNNFLQKLKHTFS